MAFTGVGTGIGGQLLMLSEGVWGVCPSGTFASGRPFEFKSEALELKKTVVQGQGLHASTATNTGLYDRLGRRVLTNYDAGGPVTMDLPTRGLALLLQHMTGSPNYGGTNLSAPTQISTTGAYQSYHSPGYTAGLSMSWQKGVPAADTGAVEPFTYVGCKISDWEISVQTGAIAQLAITIDARNELGGTGNSDPLNASVPTLGAFSEAGLLTARDPLSVFHFREASLFTGGTPTLTTGVLTMPSQVLAGNIKSASIKETHMLDNARYFLGSSGFKAEQLENGFRQLTGAFEIEWLSSEAIYNAYSADTTTGLQLTFTGGVAGTSGANNDTLSIIVPNIKLDGESPKIAGPQIVSQACSFTGLDDNATLPYQINYISSDATT